MATLMRKTWTRAMKIPGPTKDERVAMRVPSSVHIAKRWTLKKKKRKKVRGARIHLCQMVVPPLYELGLRSKPLMRIRRMISRSVRRKTTHLG
jgi:hypothetical protein